MVQKRAFLKVRRCYYVPSQQLVCDSLVERKWQSLRPLGGIIETNEGPGFCTRAVHSTRSFTGSLEKCPLQAKHCPSSRLHKAPLSQFIGSAFSWLIAPLSGAPLFELTFRQLLRCRIQFGCYQVIFIFFLICSKQIFKCKIYSITPFCSIQVSFQMFFILSQKE